MFKKSWTTWVIVVLVAMVFGAQAVRVRAQSAAQASAANTIEIVGVIDAVNGTTITVNGLSIDVSHAERAGLFKVGDKVKIEGAVAADGSITAREVNAPQTGMQPGETELVGVVDSVNGTTIVIGGQTIDISGAEVKAAILAGQTVKVEFSVDASGQIVVREVKVTPPVQTAGAGQGQANGSVEITGTLDQIGDGFVVVSGQRFDLSQAEIKGNLVVGALVKVEVRTVNGQPVAHEIETEHPENNSAFATGGGKNGADDSQRGANTGRQNSGQGNQNPGSNQTGDNHGGQQSGGSSNSGSGSSGGGSGGGSHDGGHGGGHH